MFITVFVGFIFLVSPCRFAAIEACAGGLSGLSAFVWRLLRSSHLAGMPGCESWRGRLEPFPQVTRGSQYKYVNNGVW